MRSDNVIPEMLDKGKYCNDGVPGCYCKVGFPYEEQCVDCRDTRDKGDDESRCVCGPKDK